MGLNKRVCVFALNTNDGLLYHYQQFHIQQMLKMVEYIYIVSDVKIKNKMYDFERTIYIEGIQGYDIDKWRYVFLKYYQCLKDKEVIIINDSFFGPLYEWNSVFAAMRLRKCDFWGLTKHKKICMNNEIVAQPFIQRYFMVFRPQLVKDKRFFEFWEKIPEIKSYTDTETFFEFKLTEYFMHMGYSYDIMCKCDEIEPESDTYFQSHILFNTYYLIYKKSCPIVPIYAFQVERDVVLNYSSGDNVTNTLQYVETNTKYPIGYIYEFLLKNLNAYDLSINLNLVKTIPRNTRDYLIKIERGKVAIFVYLFYEDLFEELLGKLVVVPPYIDIFVITNSKLKVDKIKKYSDSILREINVIVSRNIGREWGAWLLDCKELIRQYKYVCLLHDKKTRYLAYPSIGRAFQDLLWDNLVGTENYINNIINFFEKSKCVGVLVPPIVNHSIYCSLYSDFWTVCYEKTAELAKRFNIPLKLLNHKKPPISIGSAFWVRTEAIKNMLEYEIKDSDFPSEPLDIDGTMNHALERIVPYVVQNAGFFTVTVMDEQYSAVYNTNCQYMLRKVLKAINYTQGDISTFQDYINVLGHRI